MRHIIANAIVHRIIRVIDVFLLSGFVDEVWIAIRPSVHLRLAGVADI
jgi:hypothetical protein